MFAAAALFSCKSVWFFVSCLVAGFVKCPDQSQPKTRKDEKIFPDGQDSVNVAGLGAEEHLAAIHADQFHRLLRADSFDDFQDM